MEAEIQALLSGLSLLRDYGLQDYDLIIETDSKMLVDMVNQRVQTSWKFWTLFVQIFAMLRQFKFQIQHTYHESNRVADAFANKGVSDRLSIMYDSTENIPSQINLLMRQDAMQIRNLRTKILAGG